MENLQEFDEKIENSTNHLKEIGEREVPVDPEIEKIKDTLQAIIDDLQENEAIIMPKTIEIAKIQKTVKEILDAEIENRLKIISVQRKKGLKVLKELKKERT